MLRFAPSPTGDMHIDNLRVAILNYLVAQQRNDQFLVRIEDTETKKNIEGKDTEIMMILEKFALKHNSVFHQSEHLNLHQTLALRLLKEGKAFICKCNHQESITPYSGECEALSQADYESIKTSGEPFVVRLKKPEAEIIYQDLIKGEITTTPNEVDAFVILDTKSKPTYIFASACADMLSNINFIIREEIHLDDTPKQIHVKNLLGYNNKTEYAHLPIIQKEDNETSVKWLLEQGFIPDAILNYFILLGNSKMPQEIFTLPQAIEWFDLDSISKAEVKFDIDKLRFINREHLKMMDDRELSTLFGFADADIGRLAKVYLEEVSTINELEAKIRPIFSPKDFNGTGGEEMKIIAKIIDQAPYFESFDSFWNHISKESGLQEENLFRPLRYLLTGAETGPELSDIYACIKSYILEVAS
jgi:glutamyl-tRNA synthetase